MSAQSFARFLYRVLVVAIVMFAAQPSAASRKTHGGVSAERRLMAHTDSVYGLAFLPDGTHLVSASADKTVKLWDTTTGEMQRSFEGHDGAVGCVATSSDGKLIASGGADRTVRVWDVKSGDQIALLEGHTSFVVGVAFLADGRLVSVAGDGFRVWDVAHEKLLKKTAKPPGIERVAFSRDGTRAAAMSFAGNCSYWDAEACERLVTLGDNDRLSGVGISADGLQVFYPTPQKWHRYDVVAKRSEDITADGFGLGQIAFTPDQKTFVTTAGSLAHVWDAQSMKRKTSLSGRSMEFTRAVAVSKDGRHVAVGTGGAPMAGGAMPGRHNEISVYDLGSLDQAAQFGPVAGRMSWDVIPAKVKPITGPIVPLDAYCEPRFIAGLGMTPAGPGLDVLWDRDELMFHRQAGLLQVVWFESEAKIASVKWDGKHVWVFALAKGLMVFDREGKLITTVPMSQLGSWGDGSPSDMCVLGEGRVLMTGFGGVDRKAPQLGWCAAAALAPGAASVTVKMLVDERGPMPAGWIAKPEGSANPSFIPQKMYVQADASGRRFAWLTCRATAQSPMPVIKIDAESLAVSLYNIPTAGDAPVNSNAYAAISSYLVPLGPGKFLGRGDSDSVQMVTLGPKTILDSPPVFVGEWRTETNMDSLAFDGQVYFPGPYWMRVDPVTLNPEDLGPGIRVEGEAVRDGINYAESSLLGLCGVSAWDGAFYKISTDPAHPLSNRGTAQPPRKPPSGSENGVMEYSRDEASFYCGQGEISFFHGTAMASDYGADTRRPGDFPPDFWPLSRLSKYAGERARVALTAAQLAQVTAALGSMPRDTTDTGKLNQLFRPVQNAPDFPSRIRAARALFDEARAYGQRRAKSREDFAHQTASILNPLQLKLVRYEHLAPEDLKAQADAKVKTGASADEVVAQGQLPPSVVQPEGGWSTSVIVCGVGLLAIAGALVVSKLRGRSRS